MPRLGPWLGTIIGCILIMRIALDDTGPFQTVNVDFIEDLCGFVDVAGPCWIVRK